MSRLPLLLESLLHFPGHEAPQTRRGAGRISHTHASQYPPVPLPLSSLIHPTPVRDFTESEDFPLQKYIPSLHRSKDEVHHGDLLSCRHVVWSLSLLSVTVVSWFLLLLPRSSVSYDVFSKGRSDRATRTPVGDRESHTSSEGSCPPNPTRQSHVPSPET